MAASTIHEATLRLFQFLRVLFFFFFFLFFFLFLFFLLLCLISSFFLSFFLSFYLSFIDSFIDSFIRLLLLFGCFDERWLLEALSWLCWFFGMLQEILFEPWSSIEDLLQIIPAMNSLQLSKTFQWSKCLTWGRWGSSEFDGGSANSLDVLEGATVTI